jgi:hypothetical protein
MTSAPHPGPTATIKDAARRRAVADEMVALVEKRIPDLTSAPELMPRQFAALAVARCCRLFRAIGVLTEAGMTDLCSLPVRPLYEVMLVGFYTLYGGHDAYDEVRGAYVRELGLLPEVAREGSSLVENWAGPKNRINWEDLGRKVGALMEEKAGEPNATAFLTSWYDLLYRGESINAVHAGVGSLQRHLIHGDGWVGTSVVGKPVDVEGTGPLLVAAVLLGLLAYHVIKAFGFSAEVMGSLHEALKVEVNTAELIVDDPSGEIV